jgi:hypothetical protein
MRTFEKESNYNGIRYNRNNENYGYYRIGSEYRNDFGRFFGKIYVLLLHQPRAIVTLK